MSACLRCRSSLPCHGCTNVFVLSWLRPGYLLRFHLRIACWPLFVRRATSLTPKNYPITFGQNFHYRNGEISSRKLSGGFVSFHSLLRIFCIFFIIFFMLFLPVQYSTLPTMSHKTLHQMVLLQFVWSPNLKTFKCPYAASPCNEREKCLKSLQVMFHQIIKACLIVRSSETTVDSYTYSAFCIHIIFSELQPVFICK